MTANGVAMTAAITKLIAPVKPSSMESVAPRRPDMIPSGSPKFSPQPECTIGTIASTSTAFQLKRLMVLVICIARLQPTSGAMINSSSRKQAMIRRGSPKASSIPCILCASVGLSRDSISSLFS